MILVCIKVANSQKHYFFHRISKLIYIITVHGVFKMLTESDFFQYFSICNVIDIPLIFEAIVEICTYLVLYKSFYMDYRVMIIEHSSNVYATILDQTFLCQIDIDSI